MKAKIILATMLTVLAMGCKPSSNKSTNSAANNEARIDSTEFLKPTDINITEKKMARDTRENKSHSQTRRGRKL